VAASFLASFVIFILSGIYTFWVVGIEFTKDPAVKILVSLTLLANATFYYYVAAYLEMNNEVCDNLNNNSPVVEWYIRVVNMCLLFSLWFCLQRGWIPFGVVLLLIYATYLIWDAVTWRCFNSHFLFRLDLVGFLVTLIFLFLGFTIEKQGTQVSVGIYFIWGATTLGYWFIAILGIRSCGFFPFGREQMVRPRLH